MVRLFNLYYLINYSAVCKAIDEFILQCSSKNLSGGVSVFKSGISLLHAFQHLATCQFLGWFIVFSRQIAAIEADRAAAQLLHAQAIEGGFEQPSSAPDQQIESRIAADR